MTVFLWTVQYYVKTSICGQLCDRAPIRICSYRAWFIANAWDAGQVPLQGKDRQQQHSVYPQTVIASLCIAFSSSFGTACSDSSSLRDSYGILVFSMCHIMVIILCAITIMASTCLSACLRLADS